MVASKFWYAFSIVSSCIRRLIHFQQQRELANKTEIKQAVESIFGVKVVKINTFNLKGKFRRMGQYGGYRPNRKKAVVTLSEDSKDLDFFEA